MTTATIILCTAPDEETGARLARGLVEAKLAACVNLLPGLRSVYRWQEEVCEEREVQLIIKTHPDRRLDVQRWLEDEHPYDVPEVLFVSVDGGSRAYLDWVREQTRG